MKRPDGVEIHWEARGEGSTVVIVPSWAAHPAVFQPLTDELASDHRVVYYDHRGTGASTRRGPYDLDTGAADLAAVIKEVGGPAVLIGLVDAYNASVRVATAQPELVRAVIGAQMVLPAGRLAMQELDTVMASDAVVEGGIQFLKSDYRGFLRAALPPGNRQMSEDEMRERISAQVAYTDQDGAVERLKAFAADEPLEHARAVRDRLWILPLESGFEPLFPPAEKVVPLIHKLLPEAHIQVLEDGIVSRPDLTATVVRQITATKKATLS